MKKAFLFLPLVLSSFCTVKYTWLKPGYNSTEKLTLKRIAVVTDKNNLPFPEMEGLLQAVTADYIAHHKEYILKKDKSSDYKKACEKKEINGYLLLALNKNPVSGNKLDLNLDLSAKLFQCDKDTLVWEAKARKSYPAITVQTSIVRSYSRFAGPQGVPYITPVYKLIRKTLKSLPSPRLNEEDIMEKIEADSL